MRVPATVSVTDMKQRTKQLGQKAFEVERVKQTVRDISLKNGIDISQAKALYKYFHEELLPLKSVHHELVPSFPNKIVNHQAEREKKKFVEDYENVAAQFEKDFLTCNGNSEKLNKDANLLEFEDFVSGFVYLSRRGKPEDRLLFLFQTVDRDADGQINHHELMELLTTHCVETERQQALYTWVKKHFQQADVDKNGVLSFGECLTILRKHPTILNRIGFDMNSVLLILNKE